MQCSCGLSAPPLCPMHVSHHVEQIRMQSECIREKATPDWHLSICDDAQQHPAQVV